MRHRSLILFTPPEQKPGGTQAVAMGTALPFDEVGKGTGDGGIDRHSLLQRLIQPEEIATLVAYLASPLAAATNGAAVRAEGGLVHTIV